MPDEGHSLITRAAHKARAAHFNDSFNSCQTSSVNGIGARLRNTLRRISASAELDQSGQNCYAKSMPVKVLTAVSMISPP
jgi:hypothetical protein